MKKIYVGGAFTSVAAIIAAWIAFGLGGSTSSSTCPLPAYPSAACTGIPAGTTLTTDATDDYVVSTAGATIDAVSLPNGCFDVRAPGVTIKNSKMQCVTTSQSAVAEDPANAPLTVEDSEIDCQSNDPASNALGGTAITYKNIRAYRLNIHNCGNALDMTADMVLQDSYIHDLFQCPLADCGGTPEPPGQPHTDGIQTGEGANLVIVHNTIQGWSHCVAVSPATTCGGTPPGAPCHPPNDGTCNGTSSVNLGGAQLTSSVSNVLLKDNLISGGGYALYCPNHPPTDLQIIRNHFSTTYGPRVGEFAPSTGCTAPGITLSGNVYHETGLPVTLG